LSPGLEFIRASALKNLNSSKEESPMRNLRHIPATAVLLLSFATPAFAGTNKDMIQLQTQVQQLQDAVARLQQSNDERMGVLKDLVQQSADSVNRLSVSMDALQKQLAVQQQADSAKTDTVSGQIQALNDSLDEIKARMNRLEKAVTDIQGQTQSINSTLQQTAPAQTVQPGQTATPPPDGQTQAPPPGAQSMVTTPPPPTGTGGSLSPAAASGAPPAGDLYKAAYNDYIAAKYAVAMPEFTEIIKDYPDDPLSGNAYYYLGEIDYRAGKYAAAERDYDKVLQLFPDSNKVPASHLHKGQALIQLKQTEAGIREFRALIQRYPVSPEATQARSKLNAMGVPIRPRSGQ